MNNPGTLLATLALALIPACGEHDPAHPDDHAHAPDGSHLPPAAAAPEEEHAHGEEALGAITIGGHAVELAQGHGAVSAGKEAHLVVKLAQNDGGATTVRAWIGGADRTLSYVGKGVYDSAHGDYDIHATAPDPLPAAPMWWIEIEQPDGAKLVGSAQPIL